MDEPLREVMYCPECGRQHVDGRWWAHRPHQNHVCRFCGHRWDNGHASIGVRSVPMAVSSH